MSNDLRGQVAIVTGGASGMGLAQAQLLGRRGARVAITDRNDESLATAAAQLSAAGIAALPLLADNRDAGALEAACLQVLDKWQRIDILVNNAGISGRRLALEEIDEAAFDAMYQTHVKGAFFLTRAVVPRMKAQRHGRIVNISSNFVLSGSQRASHYTAAKAALHGLTRAWALEFAPFGITCNTVAPALVDTPLTQDSLGVVEIERQAAAFPLGRIAQPEEIAYAVAWLASEEAAMMTGQVISPNGGISIVGL
jgi:3-oxoacyl-[acyl-carrier protein] reductase